MKFYFISKDANWQKYRLDVLTKLAEHYHHEVQILTTGKIQKHLTSNTHVKYRSFQSIFGSKLKISLMPGIIYYIIKNKPDTVFGLNNSTQLTEYLALILCKILKIKFVWWTHGYDHKKINNSFFANIKEKYVLFFLKKSDSIITFSEKGKEYLIQNNISSNKIYVAHNTLDTENIIRTKNKIWHHKSELKKELNFKETDKILIFTGRLTKNKKVDHAIQAFDKIQNTYSNTHLVIIGDGEELESLKKLTTNLKTPNIHFLGSIYDESTLAKWLTISDIYIMPAYVGLGIIHAFCYELPFITEEDENHGPEIQFLKKNSNGYIVEKNNITQLYEAIKLLLSNQEMLKSFSNKAFKIIENEGDVFSMISNMNKALSKNK